MITLSASKKLFSDCGWRESAVAPHTICRVLNGDLKVKSVSLLPPVP